ncbi:hypothetical protein DL96DRAFT_348862 [Flagelloscypha sp. PMI_526]|nr:hypothetical protein DL96DRAFT_348862 [Flagelloscypha sp. PMI_526]
MLSHQHAVVSFGIFLSETLSSNYPVPGRGRRTYLPMTNYPRVGKLVSLRASTSPESGTTEATAGILLLSILSVPGT